MKFLFDHDVPDDLSHLLRQFGRKVILLREALSTDSSDSAVIQSARDLDAILVTCNRDDSLQLAKQEPHPGIINEQLRPRSLHFRNQESEALQNRGSAINARKQGPLEAVFVAAPFFKTQDEYQTLSQQFQN